MASRAIALTIAGAALPLAGVSAQPRVAVTDTHEGGHVELDVGFGVGHATAEATRGGLTADATVVDTRLMPAVLVWPIDHLALGAAVPFQLSRSVEAEGATSDGPTGAGDLELAILFGRRAAPWLRTLAQVNVQLPTGADQLSAEAAAIGWGGTLEFALTDTVGLAAGIDYQLRLQGDLPTDPPDAFDLHLGVPFRSGALHLEPALVFSHVFPAADGLDGVSFLAGQLAAGYAVAEGFSVVGTLAYARRLESESAPGVTASGDGITGVLGIQYLTPTLW